MISNLETLKTEMGELATILDKFKFEGVQLKILDYIISGSDISSTQVTARGRMAPKQKSRKSDIQSSQQNDTKRKVTAGSGAVATLVGIYDAGFFSQPRTISDILDYCETKMAKRIKASDISGKLAKMVRSGALSRSKNADGQYEYTRER